MQVTLNEQELKEFRDAVQSEWRLNLTKEQAYLWAMILLSYHWELLNENRQESLSVITC